MRREGKPEQPRALPVRPRRVNVALSETMHAQVRAVAIREGRKVSTQLEMLLERGLRSYSLEMTA